jgi:hypothetical protein
MRDGADRLARRLEKAAEEGVEVNMWRLLGDLTMDVVGTTAFGWVNLLNLPLPLPPSTHSCQNNRNSEENHGN